MQLEEQMIHDRVKQNLLVISNKKKRAKPDCRRILYIEYVITHKSYKSNNQIKTVYVKHGTTNICIEFNKTYNF